MAAVTLTEVARRAGVSVATASRVINGSDQRTPTEAIAQRVRAAAEEAGYVANAQAQALARSTTGLIGLVVHDIADPYFSAITRGAQQVARDHRSQVLLTGAVREESAELDAVAAFSSYRTRAIILVGSRRQHPEQQLTRELDRYISNGGSVVTFGVSTIPGAQCIRVGNRDGGRLLVTSLIERGVTRFAILSGPPDLNTARDRVAGYAEALAEAGLQPLAEVHGDFTSQGGYASALRCWETLAGLDGLAAQRGRSRASRPAHRDSVCLLAVNDVIALGAMTAMRSLGLRVPDDVQVAGFDDIPTLRDHFPALTTFRLPLEFMGRKATELALERAEGLGRDLDDRITLLRRRPRRGGPASRRRLRLGGDRSERLKLTVAAGRISQGPLSANNFRAVAGVGFEPT
jgi:LacI family transcriptional regulator